MRLSQSQTPIRPCFQRKPQTLFAVAKRLLALAQRLLCLLAVGDICNDAAQRVEFLRFVEQWKLTDNTDMRTILMESQLFKLQRNTGFEHLDVVGVKGCRLLLSKNFEVGLADNFNSPWSGLVFQTLGWQKDNALEYP